MDPISGGVEMGFICNENVRQEYWKANLCYTKSCIILWFFSFLYFRSIYSCKRNMWVTFLYPDHWLLITLRFYACRYASQQSNTQSDNVIPRKTFHCPSIILMSHLSFTSKIIIFELGLILQYNSVDEWTWSRRKRVWHYWRYARSHYEAIIQQTQS